MAETDEIYGITTQGYNPKSIDVLEDETQDIAKQMFGESVDLSSQSALWKMLRISLVEDANLWLKLEDNFFNCFIQTSYGSALDLLGEDLGLERKPAHPSEVILTIYKNTTLEVIIPEESFFQTNEGIIFKTTEELTIPAGDPLTTTGDVLVEAVIAGISGNVGSHTILLPTNTIAGVSSSDNADASTGGSDQEDDDTYRLRLLEHVKAVWTAQAIRSAVLGVDGIIGVKIIEYATSYDVLVVPQTTFTAELEAEVEAAVIPVNPITVEFTIIEAETIQISVSGTFVLVGIDETTANTDASIEIGKYLGSLGIDDDVYKSKIIQSILDVNGIENVYNVVLSANALNEKHTFTTGTDSYNLNYSTGSDITQVTGTLGGSPHTFVKNTDYQFVGTPARIDWSLGGDDPDNGTEFLVTYPVPPNGIGDIEVNQNSVASLGNVNLTT